MCFFSKIYFLYSFYKLVNNQFIENFFSRFLFFIMPRPQSEGKRINKYDKNFLKFLKKKYGANYELHCENVDINEWPGHKRYTEQFKDKQKITMQRKFGNKKVQKYKIE